MPKKYVLKNKLWDEDKINRLAKEIKENAINDRKAAKELFESCKDQLDQLLDTPNIENYTKLITACSQALNQMGSANEKLIKLISILQKHQFKEMDMDAKDPGKNDLNRSLFNNLKNFVKDD